MTAVDRRTSSIRGVRRAISVAAALLLVACVALAVLAGVVNGIALLAVVFFVVFVWAVGGFTRAFWVAAFAEEVDE